MNDHSAINYSKSQKRLPLRPLLIMLGVLLLPVLVLVGAKVVGDLTKVSIQACLQSPSNLRQIGEAIRMYSKSSGGQYPGDFAALLAADLVSPAIFICPFGSDRTARGRNLPEMLKDFAGAGRCSYVYVASGMKEPVLPDAVIAFDSPAHKEPACGPIEPLNYAVLFGDGHVDSLPFPMIVQVLEDLAAGKNPPVFATDLTMQQAQQIYRKKWRDQISVMQTAGWRIPTTQAAE